MKLPGAFPYPVTPNSRARVSTEDTKARKSSEKSPAKKTNQKIVKEYDKPVFAMLEMKNTKFVTKDKSMFPTHHKELFNRQGAGLRNSRNTCYMNSILQCLVHTVPLYSDMLSDIHSLRCTCRPPETRLCISCYMRHVFRQSTSGRRVMAPKALAKNLKYISKGFSLGRQEDAHEFLTMMRDLLKRRHAEDSMDESLIKRVLRSLVLMRVTCCGCKSWTDNTEELYDMQLAIQNTDDLFGPIQHYTMEKVDVRTCKDCGKENSLLKTMFLKFPSIATFQLKRFGMDNKETKKIEKPVSFPLKLDLLSFAADTVAQDEEKKYTLYGVIVHEGSTLESGHYYCFVQISPGLWFRFNDEWCNPSIYFSRVDENEVLSERANILFYAERGTRWFTHSIIAQETPESNQRETALKSNIVQQPKDSTSPPAVIETIQVPEPPKSKQTDPATKGKTPPGSKSLGSGGTRTTKTRTSEVKETDKMKIITPHAAKSSETAKGKATHSAKSQNTDPKVRIWR